MAFYNIKTVLWFVLFSQSVLLHLQVLHLMYNEKQENKYNIRFTGKLTTMRPRQAVISFYDIFRLRPEVAKNY